MSQSKLLVPNTLRKYRFIATNDVTTLNPTSTEVDTNKLIWFRVILERDANDSAFLEQLHELQHKLQFVKAQEFKDAKAVGDVYDVVENLKYKVR